SGAGDVEGDEVLAGGGIGQQDGLTQRGEVVRRGGVRRGIHHDVGPQYRVLALAAALVGEPETEAAGADKVAFVHPGEGVAQSATAVQADQVVEGGTR